MAGGLAPRIRAQAPCGTAEAGGGGPVPGGAPEPRPRTLHLHMRQLNSYGGNMSDDTRQVRIEERLKIKIGEAKNLPARGCESSGGAARDVYCVLSLDQEEIFRTSTVERTLNPFFGEEFQFEVPRRFRYLSIYTFDRDKHTRQERVVGKVAIKREDLHLYNNKDHWFALRPVDADSEVQGKAHIEAVQVRCLAADWRRRPTSAGPLSRSESLKERPPCAPDADYWSDPETSAPPDTLLVRPLECAELATKAGQCDPYALVTLLYSDGRRLERRTKTRKKTNNPQFDECFYFPLRLEPHAAHSPDDVPTGESGGECVEARVSVWHEAAVSTFLGEVRLPLHHPSCAPAGAWYLLRSRRGGMVAETEGTPPGTRLSAGAGGGGGGTALGSLRLLLQYTVDHVLALHHYTQLSDLLLASVHAQPISASAVYVVGEAVSSKTDAAQPLVRLFTHHDLIVPIVRRLADAEISALTDATTIFRGNTLVSKMMDEAMRLVGAGYLRAVLRPTLAAVLAERRHCEIDPARVKPHALANTNLSNLRDYVERVFGAITTSYATCPSVMCRLFETLRQSAARHFPYNHEVRYSVVSGFIFLRFFAPAILGPRLFGLTTEQIDPQTHRTLTLISKTIQSLGNLVSSRSAQQVCKEEYMAALYRSFCTPRHVQAIKQFLEIISMGAEARADPSSATPHDASAVLLKEGSMLKRSETARTGVAGGGGSPRRRWTRAAYAHAKRRHFRLTSGELSWSRGGGKAPVRRLSLAGVLAVAAVEHPPAGAPLGANNMFQIVHRERVLYVQANNCVEQAEWVRLLSALCRREPADRRHLTHFHNGVWQCCGAAGAEASGCGAAPESAAARAAERLALRLDPARDLQRLHSLLIQHAERLEPQPGEAGDGGAESATLRALREATFDLEHRHRVYRRSLARDTKLGSKQAPIGDDNYLQLASGGGARAPEPLIPQPPARDGGGRRCSGRWARAAGAGYLNMSCLKRELEEGSRPPPRPERAPCEYVQVSPRTPLRRCKEYELVSDFSSLAPPAVPPRLHARRSAAAEPQCPVSPDNRHLHLTSIRENKPLDAPIVAAAPALDDRTDDAYCVLQVCEEETPPPPASAPLDPGSPPRRADREESGIFSRFSAHRKSNPTKSQSGFHRALKMSNSASNVRELASTSKPLSERLTPFFLKRKTKPPGEEPPPAAAAAPPPRPIDSSTVANTRFLSLHRYGAGAEAEDAPALPLDAADVRL